MDTDLVLTIGLALMVLSVPPLLSAWAESRPPRMGSIMAITALGMVLAALWVKPGGYAFNQIPGVVFGVAARFFD